MLGLAEPRPAMDHVFEKIDAQLKVFTRRNIVPAGIYLTPTDLQQLVEDINAGAAEVEPEASFRGLAVHEIQADKSYIATQAGGRVFIDYPITWGAEPNVDIG